MAWEWLSLIGSLPEVINGLTIKQRTNVVTKKLLISELKNNLKHFNTANSNSFNHTQLITILSNAEIMEARRNGFQFSKVKEGTITKLILQDKRNERYIGKDCEWLFHSISDKILELKAIYNIQPLPNLDNSNMTLQFSNLFFKIKLIADFINQ
jgi:hypothetical protein